MLPHFRDRRNRVRRPTVRQMGREACILIWTGGSEAYARLLVEAGAGLDPGSNTWASVEDCLIRSRRLKVPARRCAIGVFGGFGISGRTAPCNSSERHVQTLAEALESRPVGVDPPLMCSNPETISDRIAPAPAGFLRSSP